MFELDVVSNTPMIGTDDVDIVAQNFLVQVGYLPSGTDPKALSESIPYRLFMDYFMRHPSRAWTAEELAILLNTTKPTVYRHINKLRALDILESKDAVDSGGQVRKGFALRYGNLSLAWKFTESNVNMAMGNYRKTVEHLQSLVDKETGKN